MSCNHRLRLTKVGSAFFVGALMMGGWCSTGLAAVPNGVSFLISGTMFVGQAESDAAKTLGHSKCAECHKSEVAAWLKSPHGSKSFKMLSHEKAPEFAKAMGITGALSASMCANCHATKTAAATVLEGVSCERCHGGSGPLESGWFALHSKFGNPEKDRLKETKEHRAARVAAITKLGMNQSANVYALAKNCLSCHSVPNEKLVNAGHPTTKRFEMVEWSQGDVRHNFQLDQKVNAESPSLWLDAHWNGPGRTSENRKKLMYVVGQLVDLEIGLRNRAKASEGDFGKAAVRRISSTARNLGKMQHVESVNQAIGILQSMSIGRTALKTYGAGDAKLFGTAADKVAAVAQALASHSDGSDLGDVEVPDDAKGDVFKP